MGFYIESTKDNGALCWAHLQLLSASDPGLSKGTEVGGIYSPDTGKKFWEVKYTPTKTGAIFQSPVHHVLDTAINDYANGGTPFQGSIWVFPHSSEDEITPKGGEASFTMHEKGSFLDFYYSDSTAAWVVEIHYDSQQKGGAKYVTRNWYDDMTLIAPRPALLLQELAVVWALNSSPVEDYGTLTEVDIADFRLGAITEENRFRVSVGLPVRGITSGAEIKTISPEDWETFQDESITGVPWTTFLGTLPWGSGSLRPRTLTPHEVTYASLVGVSLVQDSTISEDKIGGFSQAELDAVYAAASTNSLTTPSATAYPRKWSQLFYQGAGKGAYYWGDIDSKAKYHGNFNYSLVESEPGVWVFSIHLKIFIEDYKTANGSSSMQDLNDPSLSAFKTLLWDAVFEYWGGFHYAYQSSGQSLVIPVGVEVEYVSNQSDAHYTISVIHDDEAASFSEDLSFVFQTEKILYSTEATMFSKTDLARSSPPLNDGDGPHEIGHFIGLLHDQKPISAMWNVESDATPARGSMFYKYGSSGRPYSCHFELPRYWVEDVLEAEFGVGSLPFSQKPMVAVVTPASLPKAVCETPRRRRRDLIRPGERWAWAASFSETLAGVRSRVLRSLTRRTLSLARVATLRLSSATWCFTVTTSRFSAP